VEIGGVWGVSWELAQSFRGSLVEFDTGGPVLALGLLVLRAEELMGGGWWGGRFFDFHSPYMVGQNVSDYENSMGNSGSQVAKFIQLQ